MIPLRIVLASLACLCPFSLAQEPKSDPDKTLIIISTSDIHGNLDNFPRLATLVKQYRAKYPHVLLVDSGDYFIGNPYVDDCEKRGEPLTILMNKLGYDVVTIGNHDLDYGQEALRDHIEGMPSTKFVITNANLSPTLENCFSPYVSIPIEGTLFSHTGHSLSHVGVTEIIFSTEHPVSILSKSTRAVSLNEEIPNDPEVKEIVRRFSGNPLFNQQVGVAGEEITHVTIGTLFCKAIQQASHSDIAIYNRGGVRSKNHLNKGPVTIRDIYELEPFREKIVTCSMSKADIEQLILSKFMSPTDDEGGILEVYCSGFSYQIMDGVTPSITSTLKNGVIYTVAMGDYLCSNFIFPQRGNGKPTGIDVRKALIDYLKQIKKLLNPPPSKLPIIRDTTFAL